MTFQNTTAIPHTSRLGQAVAAVTDRLHLMLRRRQSYNTTYNELVACSDRDLNDLGIARSDIHRLALEAARDVI